MKLLSSIVPENLTHYGVLEFNSNTYHCLLFENLFVMTTCRATRQYILKVFNNIFPVMRVNFGMEVFGNLPRKSNSAEDYSLESTSESESTSKSTELSNFEFIVCSVDPMLAQNRQYLLGYPKYEI